MIPRPLVQFWHQMPATSAFAAFMVAASSVISASAFVVDRMYFGNEEERQLLASVGRTRKSSLGSQHVWSLLAPAKRAYRDSDFALNSDAGPKRNRSDNSSSLYLPRNHRFVRVCEYILNDLIDSAFDENGEPVVPELAVLKRRSLTVHVTREEMASALATDGGKSILISEKFMRESTPLAWTFVLAHELGHIILDHLAHDVAPDFSLWLKQDGAVIDKLQGEMEANRVAVLLLLLNEQLDECLDEMRPPPYLRRTPAHMRRTLHPCMQFEYKWLQRFAEELSQVRWPAWSDRTTTEKEEVIQRSQRVMRQVRREITDILSVE